MGKKRLRKKLTSRSLHGSSRTLNASSAQKYINKFAAHAAGKPVKITIPNPNKEETNRPFIRVPMKEYLARA